MAKRRIRLEVEVDIIVPLATEEAYKEDGVSEDDMFDSIVQGLSVDVDTTDEVHCEVDCWNADPENMTLKVCWVEK